ncbi:MAG: hypothetical protein WAO83_23075 [Fuerstiella sp.]
MQHHHRGLWETFVGDGRSLISFCGICLALAGLFAIFQSLTGHFLPHDVEFLQMAAEELCSINECRIVHFMIHDRISFGGSLVAIAFLYLWLAEFPLQSHEPWAWWTLIASGIAGFGSFLTYLGYGYLDTWHGAATLVLLPCFVGGLWLQHPFLIPVKASIGWKTRLRFACEIQNRCRLSLTAIRPACLHVNPVVLSSLSQRPHRSRGSHSFHESNS